MRCALLMCVCLVGGCGAIDRLAENRVPEPGPTYTNDREQDGVLDIQVFRDETEIVLTNTTANAFAEGGRIWVNAEYSRPIDSMPIGRTRRFDLREFVNEYGERFRAGGFFATERPDDVVLVQIEHGGRLDGLLVVGDEDE